MKLKIPTLQTLTILTLWAVGQLSLLGQIGDKEPKGMEENFIKEAAAESMTEVKLGELGVKNASRNEVKMFAEMIVKDHTQAGQDLAKLAASRRAKLPTEMQPKHIEALQSINEKSGADFDKYFIAKMVSDHDMHVRHYEKVSMSTQDAEVKTWVEKMLPTLKSHLAKARELNASPMDAVIANDKADTTTTLADNTGRNVRDRDGKMLTPLDQGSSQNDTTITAQIRKDIMAQKGLSMSAKNVKIIALNGKVTLRGPVVNAEEMRMIHEIANRNAGVENVDCLLEVK